MEFGRLWDLLGEASGWEGYAGGSTWGVLHYWKVGQESPSRDEAGTWETA